MKSILDNIIYIRITQNSNFKIDCIKIKDKKEDFFSINLSYQCSKSSVIEIKSFIEELPLILHNGEKDKSIINNLFEAIGGINNIILDARELVLILNPTKDNKSLKLNNAEETKELINSLLINFWKNPFGYINIVSWFKNDKEWPWISLLNANIEELEKNIFTIETHKDDAKEVSRLVNIDLKKREELLKDKDIWETDRKFTYNFREGQYKMAKEVRGALEGRKVMCIEAPTGIGKSIGYLLNSIIFAYENKEKVVISTNTKSLQNQLVEKDIPLIIDRLGLLGKVSFTEIKGKGNYICKKRFLEYIKDEKENFNYEDRLLLLYINRFIEENCGDVESLDYWVYGFENFNKHLNNFICEGDLCRPSRCEYGSEKNCYYVTKLEQMKKSNIIVVNHSLLSLWPYKGDVELKYVIIDEAHNMIDQCYKAYSNELNSIQLKKWLNQIYDFRSKVGQITFLHRRYSFFVSKEDIEQIKEKIWNITCLLDNINYIYSLIFSYKSEVNYKINYPKKILISKENEWKSVNHLLLELKEGILYLVYKIENIVKEIVKEDDDSKDEMIILIINGYCLKFKGCAECIDAILKQENENMCYSLECDKGRKYWTITTIDLNIASRFKSDFLDGAESVIFTSATLKINDGFNYFSSALGLNLIDKEKQGKSLVVAPVFKINDRTKIFEPEDMPKYNYLNDDDFIKAMSKFVINIAKNFNGNILVLFSSINRKNKVEMQIRPMLRSLNVNIYDNLKGIEELKKLDRRTVVLGSKGFFEGVDIPGEGLTCVILDKVPNCSPKDPLVVSLTEKALREKKVGKDLYAYNYINYPTTSIKMKQIFGRILRTKYDYGYLFVLNGLSQNINTEKLKKDIGIYNIYRESMDNSIKFMRKDFDRWQKENYKTIISEVGPKCNIEEEYKKRNLKYK